MIEAVVEPQIPGGRWYLFADPVTAPVQGVDGVEISVIFDFGVGAVDWRGAWFNPGS